MRLDRKTRDGILEILAMSMLEYEEYLLGIPQTAASIKTLKQRAIQRYLGPVWEPYPKKAIAHHYSNLAFQQRVKRTTAAIFQAIEGPENDFEAVIREFHRIQIETIGHMPPLRAMGYSVVVDLDQPKDQVLLQQNGEEVARIENLGEPE